MKVSTSKEVFVDVEVEVGLDDCISELLGMANEDDAPRRLLSAVEGATKILSRITPTEVSKFLEKNESAKAEIRKRLQLWIDATEPKSDPVPS